MKIEIRRGEPLPPVKHPSKYPFAQMQAGDSFTVTLDDSDMTDLTALQNSVATIGRKLLGRGAVSTRKFREQNMVQVWRVK